MVHVTHDSEFYIAFDSRCEPCGPFGPHEPYANFVKPESCRQQNYKDCGFLAQSSEEDKVCLTRVWHSLPPNMRLEFFERRTCWGYVCGNGCRNARCTFHHPKVCVCDCDNCDFFHPKNKICERRPCKNKKCDLFHVNQK